MKNLGKVRRATTAAMDNPYKQGFDAGRGGSPNPPAAGIPGVSDQEAQDYIDGWRKGRELWLQCQPKEEPQQ